MFGTGFRFSVVDYQERVMNLLKFVLKNKMIYFVAVAP